MHRKWFAAGLAAVFGLSGCASGPAGASSGEMGDIETGEEEVGGISDVPNPTAEMAKAVGKPLDYIQRGHSVYMLQCGQCHYYKKPGDLFVDEWEDAMPKMIGHAGLEPEDEKAVLAYVLAVKGGED